MTLTYETLPHKIAAQVLASQPRVQQAFAAIDHQARAAVDPQLLALCENRIRQLLGAASADGAVSAELADSALGRSAIAFVEQWVIDVARISDDMVTALATELGNDTLMDFVHGVLVVEQRVRLGITWQQLGFTS